MALSESQKSNRERKKEAKKQEKKAKQQQKINLLEENIMSQGSKHHWWNIFDINKPLTLPDKNRKYKTSFRQVVLYLLIPFKGMFSFTLFMSIMQSLLFLALPLLGGDIMTDIVENSDFSAIIDNFAILFVALIGMAVVSYFRIYANQFMGHSIIRVLRGELFKSIQNATYGFLDHHSTGDLMSRCTSDLNTLRMLLSSQITMFIRECLTVFLALVAMFLINPIVTLMIVPLFPIIFYVIYRYKRKIGPLYRSSRETYGDEVTSVVEENIGGVRVVRAFATEELEIQKFNKANDHYLDQQIKLMKLQVTFEPIVRLLVNLAMAIVILYGGQLLGSGTLYIGDLFSYLILLNFAIDPLFFINTFLGNTAMYNQTCDRIVELLNNDKITKELSLNRAFYLSEKGKQLYCQLAKINEEPIEGSGESTNIGNLDEITKKIIVIAGMGINYWSDIFKKYPQLSENDLKQIYDNRPDLFVLEGAKWFKKPVKGAVKFENVSLSYNNNDFHELEDISFEVKPGEVIAILGATGSGKTSIIRLIGRFYEQDKGTITIDGIDIRDVPKKELRKLIGFVPQEAFLFSSTIRENLIIGRDDEVSMDEIIGACKLANIHDFIDSLPKKYETVVGQRGVTLSGGQRQRISIARALISRPKILILDDATSSVDVDTEYQIQKGFRTMFKDSTTFIITQRLSSVRHADKIIVLEKGRIKQFGTHSELMRDTSNIYYKLYTTLDVEGRAKRSLEIAQAVGGK